MGQKNGYHKHTFPNGDVYVGELLNDKAHGKGKYISVNGDVYDGEWFYGRKYGNGKYSYAYGTTYEGEYRNDLFDGEGKCTYSDGSSYIGKWSCGRYHGKGTYTFRNGSVYIGDWTYGQMNGNGKYISVDGFAYDGYWLNNRSDKGKYTVKIRQDEFKCDIQYLTNLLTKPVKIPDNIPFYELVFKGEITDNFVPVQGSLYIENIFRYDGHWNEGKVDGQGTLFDIADQTHEIVCFVDGHRTQPKNNSTAVGDIIAHNQYDSPRDSHNQIEGSNAEVEGQS